MKALKFALLTSLLFASQFASAISAPKYQSLAKVKAAIQAILADSSVANQINDYKIIGALSIEDQDEGQSVVQVAGNGTIYVVSVSRKPLPPGMAGNPGYTGEVTQTGTLRQDLTEVSLNELTEALEERSSSAAFTSVEVSKSGKITIK